LAKLLRFVSSSHPELVSSKEKTDETECEWAIQVAQHLLSPLAIGSQYTLDNHYKKNNLTKKIGQGEYLCPCSKKDTLEGSFGDTSFGCVDVWHGSIDIWMEDVVVNVSEFGDSREDTSANISLNSSVCSSNESIVEVKPSNIFVEKDYKKMLAQSIVFSFLQHKQNELLEIDNSLIPSLGICRSNVIVHFYDCKNDVLLQSFPLPLFIDHSLNINAVVFLWLTLNHNYLSSGITEEMKVYKANFHQKVGDRLEIYQNKLTRQVHKSTSHSEMEQELVCPASCFVTGRRSKPSVTVKINDYVATDK